MAVLVDWLGITFFPPGGVDVGFWTQIEHFLCANFGQSGYVGSDRGWQGYTRSARIGGALVAWGGEGQGGTVHLELSGSVCAECRDWAAVVEWLDLWQARITRADVAVDDFAGERISVDWAMEQYRAGGFRAARSPCDPKVKHIDDLGSGDGRTLYVGRRENGKLARVYEKGKQLGDKLSRWCRFEVEWRAKDRVIPLDVLLRPAVFLAGAFPCVAFVSSVVERVRTFREKARITVQQLVSITRRQSGRAINALLMFAGGDIGEVVSLLRRSGIPDRVDAADLRCLTMAT